MAINSCIQKVLIHVLYLNGKHFADYHIVNIINTYLFILNYGFQYYLNFAGENFTGNEREPAKAIVISHFKNTK